MMLYTKKANNVSSKNHLCTQFFYLCAARSFLLPAVSVQTRKPWRLQQARNQWGSTLNRGNQTAPCRLRRRGE